MAANSNIQWTEATWNPVVGCEAISPGCANCYAATMTRRLEAMGQANYSGLTTKKHFNGTVRCLPHKLDMPLKRRKPTMYFVNSMSDLFHEDVPDEFIAEVFRIMGLASQHTFQVLTKRAERMASFVQGNVKRPGRDPQRIGEPYSNVWLGVSCEDQKRADERIPWLLKTTAAVRFISAEPLLGPIELGHLRRGEDDAFNCLDGIGGPNVDWVIVGGESGPDSRPCNVAWIRSIVEQCCDAEVACFVKQFGLRPYSDADKIAFKGWDHKALLPERKTAAVFWHYLNNKKGGDPEEWPEDLRVREMPTKVEA